MIEDPLRMPEARIRRCSGIGMNVGCAVLLGAIVLTPSHGYGQALFGDPSATLGGFGQYRLEAGRGVIDSYNLHFVGKVVSVKTNQLNTNLIESETREGIKSELTFLTATAGLTKSIDVFLTARQYRIQTLFDGGYGPAGGLGFRFSPPQTGLIKMGLLAQVFYATSENNGFDTSVDTWFEPDSRYIERHIVASGTAKDKLRLISYDLLLGVGLQNIPYVRPYGGILVSVQNRTEKGSFSGQGDVFNCPFPGTRCIVATTPVSLSWNTDVSSDSVFAGLLGVTITPIEWIGVNFEYLLGRSRTGNLRGFMASAFVDF
jgi:hypothetical protein